MGLKEHKTAAWGLAIGGLLTIASLSVLVTLGSQITFDGELDAAEKRVEKKTVQTFKSLQRESDAKFERHILEYYSDRLHQISRHLERNPDDQRAVEDLDDIRVKQRKAVERFEKMK
jgi:hypothetical protein